MFRKLGTPLQLKNVAGLGPKLQLLFFHTQFLTSDIDTPPVDWYPRQCLEGSYVQFSVGPSLLGNPPPCILATTTSDELHARLRVSVRHTVPFVPPGGAAIVKFAVFRTLDRGVGQMVHKYKRATKG